MVMNRPQTAIFLLERKKNDGLNMYAFASTTAESLQRSLNRSTWTIASLKVMLPDDVSDKSFFLNLSFFVKAWMASGFGLKFINSMLSSILFNCNTREKILYQTSFLVD